MDLKLSVEAQHDWNLRVLQRRDPAISRIVGSACFVSLYTFDTDARAWAKLDVEGTLFVLCRNAEPRYRVLVLNKLSPDDHETDLTAASDLEVSDTYLMMTTSKGAIEGYWFYDSQERELVTEQLQKLLQELKSQDDPSLVLAIPYAVQPQQQQQQQHHHHQQHQQHQQQRPSLAFAPSHTGAAHPMYYAPFPQYASHTAGVYHQQQQPPPLMASDLESSAGGADSSSERERFRRALIRLVQTDDDFVDKIYDAFMNE